jgi:hypothetical protein
MVPPAVPSPCPAAVGHTLLLRADLRSAHLRARQYCCEDVDGLQQEGVAGVAELLVPRKFLH